MAPSTSSRQVLSMARGGRMWLLAFALSVSLVTLAMIAGNAFAAQPTVGLGTADSFAVLAGSAVTNTGSSTINGNLGVDPTPAVTGFPPGTVNGTIHKGDAVAGQAKTDLTTAYNDAAGRTPAVTVAGSELGGLTLTSGVYRSGSSLGLTGPLTLDGQGNADAVFIFQAGSTLTTASASRVNLINGAQACNVFWKIGSSATLGTSSVFVGSILALTSISMNNGVVVHGRALARNGAVTLINDTITAAHCATTGGGGGTTGGGGGTTGGGGGTTGGGGGTTGGGTTGNGAALFTTKRRSVAESVARTGTTRCVHGRFRAVVTGLFIRRVVFTIGTKVFSRRTRSPFDALVPASAGIHTIGAHVTFSDGTRAVTLRFRYRACAAAKRRVVAPAPPSQPPHNPGGFTG